MCVSMTDHIVKGFGVHIARLSFVQLQATYHFCLIMFSPVTVLLC